MYTKDKITYCNKIAEQGNFVDGGQPFYVFFAPKSAEAASVVIANCMLVDGASEVPFTVCAWNPVSILEINISAEMIQNYDIFFGRE